MLSPSIASLAANPSLEILDVDGRLPKAARTIAGPISRFWHYGQPDQTAPPTFLQPERLRWLERSRTKSFDFDSLRDAVNLDTLRLEVFPRLINIDELRRLAHLERLTLHTCDTDED